MIYNVEVILAIDLLLFLWKCVSGVDTAPLIVPACLCSLTQRS